VDALVLWDAQPRAPPKPRPPPPSLGLAWAPGTCGAVRAPGSPTAVGRRKFVERTRALAAKRSADAQAEHLRKAFSPEPSPEPSPGPSP